MQNKLYKLLWVPILAAAVLHNNGCAGGNSSGMQPPHPQIAVSVSPGGAQSVDQGQTKSFTATVTNDSSNKGVSWTLTQNGASCSPGCGSISPTTTASGTAATYIAPATVNANLQFSVTAASVADTTKSASDSTTIVPPPALSSPATLPAATVGQPYSYTLTETGGISPYTWSVTAGSLPPGLTLNSSTGVISGTPTAAAAAVAKKSSFAPNPAAQPPGNQVCFTVQVQDSGNPPLTNTAQVCLNVSPGQSPSQLAFVQQPTNVAAGSSITPSVSVAVEDASGSVVTTATNIVSITIGANPSGGALSGTPASTAVNGVVTFPNQSIDKAGNGYTLTASAAGLTSATSNSFSVSAGAATQLVFLQQPTSVAAGSAITPAVTVAIEDNFGNLVTTATNSVTIAIGTNPAAGMLSGTVTASAVSGVAPFSTLSIDKAGNGYTLTASAASLKSATSSTFNVGATGPQINISSAGNFNMQRSAALGNTGTFNIPAVLTATGGTPPYTWSASGLPDPTFSISADPSGNGVISTTGGYQIGSFTATVTVKDSTGASNSANVPLTVGCVLADYTGLSGVHNNNVALVGTYAYLASGFADQTFPVARAGSFVATDQGENPNTLLGVISSGVEDDEQSASSSIIVSQGSRFCIDLDGSGTLILNVAPNGGIALPTTYRIRGALQSFGSSSGGLSARMIEVAPFRTTGEMRLQDPAVSFGTGNYVFGLSGRDAEGGPASAAGDFTISNLQSPGGASANGEADYNDVVLLGAATKYSPITVAFAADAFNVGRYTGTIKSTDSSLPQITFVAYLVPGFVWPGFLSNKSADLFVVSTQGFIGPSQPQPPFGLPSGVTGKIHLQNLARPLTYSDLRNQEAVYYRVGAVPPDLPKNNVVPGSAVTIGSVLFEGQYSIYSEDSDIAGVVSSTGFQKFADTSTVSATGRVTAGANGAAAGYLWDKAMAVWIDSVSPNAAIGELFPLTLPIFQETGQVNSCTGPVVSPGTPAFNAPAATWESPVGVGSVAGGSSGCPNPPSTNFGLSGDINGLTGFKFDIQTGHAGTVSGLPFTISELNGGGAGFSRYTVGDCPDSSNTGQPCFVGYGYGSLFQQILIETNLGPGDPSGLSPGPNKYPVLIVW